MKYFEILTVLFLKTRPRSLFNLLCGNYKIAVTIVSIMPTCVIIESRIVFPPKVPKKIRVFTNVCFIN